jgi:hypothetical protein
MVSLALGISTMALGMKQQNLAQMWMCQKMNLHTRLTGRICGLKISVLKKIGKILLFVIISVGKRSIIRSMDALRLYLINSLVVRAESMRFKKDGVNDVVKDVFLPWYNAYRFLVQNTQRLEAEGLSPFRPIDHSILRTSTNVLDQ